MIRRTILDQFLRDNRPPWQRWAIVVVGFLLLLLAPVLAHSQGAGADTVQLVWTAPGDDAAVGRASGYEMRFSTAPITGANWDFANIAGPAPNPLEAGRRQAITVRGLSSDTTYYFAIRTVDDAGNWSGVSNLLRWDWVVDTAPPSIPLGISAVRFAPNVRVTWAGSAEMDLDGYAVYRATSAGGPFARVNATLVTGTQYLDSSVPAGATSAWYQVTASDLSGNESAPSPAVQVQLVAAPPPWSLSPVYPNPSRSTQPVCVPIAIPASGVGEAAVDIVNAGGLRIRHIPVATATTCAGGNGVQWDGMNDSGRIVAPGVYRAWLIADGMRESVKLVRVP
jgi:chitodextrinase